jgi:hypothetical protein
LLNAKSENSTVENLDIEKEDESNLDSLEKSITPSEETRDTTNTNELSKTSGEDSQNPQNEETKKIGENGELENSQEPTPEITSEIKMTKKSEAGVVETQSADQSTENTQSQESEQKEGDNAEIQHDSDASSVESGEPFVPDENSEKAENQSVSSEESAPILDGSSDDSGILQTDEFADGNSDNQSEGSVDFGDDVDALLDNYEENEFIGIVDDKGKSGKRKRKNRNKPDLDAI